jgi:hypothetical protein
MKLEARTCTLILTSRFLMLTTREDSLWKAGIVALGLFAASQLA